MHAREVRLARGFEMEDLPSGLGDRGRYSAFVNLAFRLTFGKELVGFGRVICFIPQGFSTICLSYFYFRF